jgi:hypothetical protein
VLSVFDIEPGSRKLTDWADLVDADGNLAPVQKLHVQKDIIAWARELGSVATLSFIDQSFSQCDEAPMAPGRCSLMDHLHPGDFNGDGIVNAARMATQPLPQSSHSQWYSAQRKASESSRRQSLDTL